MNLHKFHQVKDMPESYDLLSQDDFDHFCELQGVTNKHHCSAGFARIETGEIIEIWGFVGIVPDMEKGVTLLWCDVHRELSHAYHAIGELCKTKRYPKRAETFINRVWQWLYENRQYVSASDIDRFTVICAYNWRWLNVSALEINGISRDSLWIER